MTSTSDPWAGHAVELSRLIIIADFPPGPTPALKAMSRLADLHLVTLLADTASLSLLPQIEKPATGGVLNQKGPLLRAQPER
jgi:hypothetical protein